jgi:ABC-type multidrug transport system permease subunit
LIRLYVVDISTLEFHLFLNSFTFFKMQIGLLFYVCIFWTSSSIFGAVYVFPFEKFFLVKERKADMYRLSAYYVCSTLCDMIAHVTYPTVFMSILYFMVNFKKTLQCFFLTLSTVLLIAVTSQVSLHSTSII